LWGGRVVVLLFGFELDRCRDRSEFKNRTEQIDRCDHTGLWTLHAPHLAAQLKLLRTVGRAAVATMALASAASGAKAGPALSLETLAYKYGTDKAKDDHKYVDLYHSLFHDRRLNVLNVTEIGVAKGQSVAMWADYFEKAQIWGIDPGLRHAKEVVHYFQSHPRVHLLAADAYMPHTPTNHSFAPESQDIIIDVRTLEATCLAQSPAAHNNALRALARSY
jgi:hypothetical protein